MATPNWPGTAGLPALAGRGAWSRKSLQLPWATGNSETDAPEVLWGSGTPEGNVVGRVGDHYIQEDGLGGKLHWEKVTGNATNTGWFKVVQWGGIERADWFAGSTNEAKIEAAMDEAIARSENYVWVPLSMIPYDANLITQSKFGQVRLIREGGDHGVFDVVAYGAPLKNTSLPAPDILRAMQRAIYACNAFGGGIVSMLSQSGKFYISGDFMNNLLAYNTTPMEIHFGAAEYYIVTRVNLQSHKHLWLHNTWLKNADANGARAATPSIMFYLQENAIGGPSNGVITTNASAVITKKNVGVAAWNYLEVGSPLAIFGRKPYLGKDNTTINIGGGIDASTATITVASTTGFPSTGTQYLRIENELITYTGVTATTFTGCTRGVLGSTAATHADTTAVERCVYEAFTVKSISGNDITLDSTTDPRAVMDASWGSGSEGASINLGALDVRFEGSGKIDGMWRETGAGEAQNASGVFGYYTRGLHIGAGITVTGWEFGGVTLNAPQDATHLCPFDNCGNRFEQVGSAFWWFGGAKRCTAHVPSAIDCFLVAAIDDRSTAAVLFDMPCWGNVVVCDFCSNVGGSAGVGFLIGGGFSNHVHVKVARNIPANAAFAQFQTNQWITNVAGEDNFFQLDSFNGDATATAFATSSTYSSTGRNTAVINAKGCKVDIQSGVGFLGRKGAFALTDAATIAVDASLGDHAEVTLGGNRAIGTPTNPVDGQEITFSILQDGTGGRTLTWPTGAGNFVLTWSDTGNTANKRSVIKARYSKGRNRWEQTAAQTPYV